MFLRTFFIQSIFIAQRNSLLESLTKLCTWHQLTCFSLCRALQSWEPGPCLTYPDPEADADPETDPDHDAYSDPDPLGIAESPFYKNLSRSAKNVLMQIRNGTEDDLFR